MDGFQMQENKILKADVAHLEEKLKMKEQALELLREQHRTLYDAKAAVDAELFDAKKGFELELADAKAEVQDKAIRVMTKREEKLKAGKEELGHQAGDLADREKALEKGERKLRVAQEELEKREAEVAKKWETSKGDELVKAAFVKEEELAKREKEFKEETAERAKLLLEADKRHTAARAQLEGDLAQLKEGQKTCEGLFKTLEAKEKKLEKDQESVKELSKQGRAFRVKMQEFVTFTKHFAAGWNEEAEAAHLLTPMFGPKKTAKKTEEEKPKTPGSKKRKRALKPKEEEEEEEEASSSPVFDEETIVCSDDEE